MLSTVLHVDNGTDDPDPGVREHESDHCCHIKLWIDHQTHHMVHIDKIHDPIVSICLQSEALTTFNAGLLVHGNVGLVLQEGECASVNPQHDVAPNIRHILLPTMNVVLAHRKAERVIVEASLVNFRAKHLVSQNEKVDENHTEQSHEEVVAWSYRRKAIVQIVRNVTVTAQVLHKEEKVDIHPKAIPISVGMPQEEPSQVFEYDDGVVCEGCGLV